MPTDSNESPNTISTIPLHESSTSENLLSSMKQINKLKRFLSTLYHFGSDISNEIGERVRALILALVNNALSVEEFHSKVQSTTNFPLRPFALPFLKSTLPHLQKDLSQLAHQSKQPTSQYLAQHEDLILLPREMLERSSSPPKEHVNENGKRKNAEEDERNLTMKRSIVNHSRPFIASNINNSLATSTAIRREKDRTFATYLRDYGLDKTMEDDWKNAENMLNYILEMVTKAKRVLFILQQKDNHLRHLIESHDLEWRRRHTDLLAQTDERIGDIRRKAEETVLEIKRQSIVDRQKAVSQTEQKSNEILLREREQYQRLKAQKFEETYALFNRQEEGPEQCWHCARKAIETCSGCNIARYCGQYCQHRDWEFHQKICGPDLKHKLNEMPQIHRYSFPKFSRSTSSNQPMEASPSHSTRVTSDTNPSTPSINVSSPIATAETSLTTPNEDEQNEMDQEEEITKVKSENI